MSLDFSEGEVQTMRIGHLSLIESTEMIAKLSAVVQAQGGMFEFKCHHVETVSRAEPLMVNQLVISLVCFVDEQIARLNAADTPQSWYMLEFPQPEIWIEPELNAFFLKARHALVTGVHCENLAEQMKLDVAEVHKHLSNLRLLGVVKRVEGAETVPLTDVDTEQKIARKSNEFLRASRATKEIKKITGRLLRSPETLEGGT